jgi:EAL domain-containing protein (putative c-di-GMP-specific phosphodiesterase class I)
MLEQRLRVALNDRLISVAYQPVVLLETGRVIGFEALARWNDPVLGVVSPEEFIPVAEQCGLIGRLGDDVARRALREFSERGPVVADVHLSINVSAAQLRQPDHAEGLLDLMNSSGLHRRRLIVEVTESTFVDVDDPALRALAYLRQAGVSVAIDDFGTGYSTLGYLNRLPANVIKVDKSLTFGASTDDRCRTILRAVSDLALSLPAEVVVEGIETVEQRAMVQATGATYGQGWLFSPAVGIEEVAGLVARPGIPGLPAQASGRRGRDGEDAVNERA